MPLPDTNVYGQVLTTRDLHPVAEVLRRLGYVIHGGRSSFDGTTRLRFERASAEFATQALSDQEHLFNGAVVPEEAAAILDTLSRALGEARIVHRLELYDDKMEPIGYFHHAWPQGRHSKEGK